METVLFAIEGVEGAGDLVAALFEDVKVLLGRARVLVAQQFLNPSQIFALLEQVGGSCRGTGRSGSPSAGTTVRCVC